MKSPSAARLSLASLVLPVFLSLLMIASPSTGHAQDDVQMQAPAQPIVLPPPWTRDWNAARERSVHEKLPMLAMFSADWSPPCQEVLTQLLTLKDVQDQLRDNWVPVFVDEAQYPELHKRYQIRALPTFIVFNLQGEEHTRFVGSREPADFLGQLQHAYDTMVDMAQIRDALSRDPRNPFIYKAYGDLLLDLGRFEQAEEAYNNACKYDPDNKTGSRADLMFLKALKVANEDPSKGMDMFNKLAATYPDSPRVGDAIYVSAMIELQQFKDFQRGRVLLEEYLKKYPDGRFVEIAQEQLKTIENRR